MCIWTVGYPGSEGPVFTDDGIFFPQWVVPRSNTTDMLTVLVTSQLGWSFGGPGFATVQGQNVPGSSTAHVAAQEARSVLMCPVDRSLRCSDSTFFFPELCYAIQLH